MAFIPRKACNLVIGLQTAMGTEASGGLVKIPLPDGCKPPNLKPNYEMFGYGGGHYGEALYDTKGVAIEGSMTIPLVPGYVAPGTGNPLGQWLWGRQDADHYFEGYYATVYVDRGNGLIEKYVDCKAKNGRVKVDFGAPFASFEVDIEGINLPEQTTFGDADDSLFTIRPYRYCEATISANLGGDYAGEAFSRNHNLEFDNMIDPVEAVNGTTTKAALPNSDKALWKGSFDRMFVDTSFYDAFVTGSEIGYKLTLTRTGVASCEIEMPRCLIVDHGLEIPAKGLMKETGINFHALQSLDGATDSCTITESAQA